MITALLISVILGYLPMIVFSYAIYWLDRYEKEPLPLLLFAFLWGAVIAAMAAFVINTLLGAGVYWLTNSTGAATFSVSSIFAPIIEEIFKGIAVLIVFLFFRSEFDSILDGIIYAAVTALGFAATENAYYIFSMGYAAAGWQGLFQLAFIRIVLVGWQHPFYTAFFGIGLALARTQKSHFIKFFAPLGGLMLAIISHSLHNTISPLLIYNAGWSGMLHASQLDWLGWGFMLIFVIFMIQHEETIMKTHLLEEIQHNIITQNQYLAVVSHYHRKLLKATVLQQEKSSRKVVAELCQLSAELAHKKHQYLHHGNEQRNLEIIQDARKRLFVLSQQLRKYDTPLPASE